MFCIISDEMRGYYIISDQMRGYYIILDQIQTCYIILIRTRTEDITLYYIGSDPAQMTPAMTCRPAQVYKNNNRDSIEQRPT